MKKLFTMLCFGAFALSLSASDYNAMVFTMNNGSQKSISTENLEITFSNSELQAKSNQTVLTLTLTDVKSMNFGETVTSSVSSLESEKESTVYIFTLSGIYEGSFPSLSNAVENLENGIYVIRNTEGKTFKITVEK